MKEILFYIVIFTIIVVRYIKNCIKDVQQEQIRIKESYLKTIKKTEQTVRNINTELEKIIKNLLIVILIIISFFIFFKFFI